MNAPPTSLSIRLLLQPALHENDFEELDALWPMNPRSKDHLSAPPRRRLPGVSPAMNRLRQQLQRIGPHFRTALVTGERGLNKEEIARALHEASPAVRGPFVVCDSSRIESLRSAEAKPAGAQAAEIDRELVEDLTAEAAGGTIFVRELGDLSDGAQQALLDLLDVMEEVAGPRIRVIASLSGDLRSLVAAGSLRPELETRLGVITLAVTPLRDRPEDIGQIARSLLDQLAAELEAAPAAISPEAQEELAARVWTGNERELEAVLRSAVAEGDGATIRLPDLPEAVRASKPRPVAETVSGRYTKLQDVVDAHVQAVLRKCDGNKLKAAEMLGISRSTLYRMLENSSPDAGRIE